MSSLDIIVPALSVLVSGGVAVLAPRQAAKSEDTRLTRQINASRLDELRAVLEDAGLALSEGCEAARLLRILVPSPIPNDPEIPLAQQRMTSALEAAGNQVNRLLIRVGPDNHLTSAYRDALAALGAADATTWRMIQSDDQSLRGRVAEFVSQAHKRTDEFYIATAEAVGPEVPEPVARDVAT
jgi:hypothetical protein